MLAEVFAKAGPYLRAPKPALPSPWRRWASAATSWTRRTWRLECYASTASRRSRSSPPWVAPATTARRIKKKMKDERLYLRNPVAVAVYSRFFVALIKVALSGWRFVRPLPPRVSVNCFPGVKFNVNYNKNAVNIILTELMCALVLY